MVSYSFISLKWILAICAGWAALAGNSFILLVHTFWINIFLQLVFALNYSKFNLQTTSTLCFRVSDIQGLVKEIVQFCFFLNILSGTGMFFIVNTFCQVSEVNFPCGCRGCWAHSCCVSEHVLLAQLSGSLNLLFLQFTFMSLSVANALGNSGNLFTSWPISFLVSVTYWANYWR